MSCKVILLYMHTFVMLISWGIETLDRFCYAAHAGTAVGWNVRKQTRNKHTLTTH